MSELPREATEVSTEESGHHRDPITGISKRDKELRNPQYSDDQKTRQRYEGIALCVAIIITIILVGVVLWWHWRLRCLLLALLGGLLGGLLQDAKFFYKSVGDGNWIWDKLWWRLLTPLLSGAMGFSVFVILMAFGHIESLAKESEYYPYGIGFLTGLFADNAMQKLRDIAYVVFGTPKEAIHKPDIKEEQKKNKSR